MMIVECQEVIRSYNQSETGILFMTKQITILQVNAVIAKMISLLCLCKISEYTFCSFYGFTYLFSQLVKDFEAINASGVYLQLSSHHTLTAHFFVYYFSKQVQNIYIQYITVMYPMMYLYSIHSFSQ